MRSGGGRPFPLQPARCLRDQQLQLVQDERGRRPGKCHRLDAIQPGDEGTRLLHDPRVEPFASRKRAEFEPKGGR